jgi:putative membrane-bound dehydrogenase-like protein
MLKVCAGLVAATALGSLTVTVAGLARAGEKVEPRAAPASLRALRVRPGFEVELVAAEPLVQDPIALGWGADGKLWVVEMGDYPLGADNRGKPGGRIKYLEDTHGDGRYVKATLFLDGLKFPSGVMPWRKGALVACAPEIFYAEAASGDGKANVRRPLFVGFDQCNPQHRVNSLAWGLDNWVHGAVGAIYTSSGRKIRSTKTGTVTDIPGRDFRLRPDDGAFDAQTGQTQFGRCMDDWGNAFGCNNTEPMFHFVLADQYLRRNPHVAGPEPRVQLPFSHAFPAGRSGDEAPGPRAFTAACGLTVYRDDLFGPAFRGNAFVSDPAYNLVHREILAADGVTFTSRRAADEARLEFLASADDWVRPTSLQTGPDGALWVACMYRQVIEHPDFIPPEVLKQVDIRGGHDKGRIYRIYPTGKRPRPIPRLDRLDTVGLVAALDSPNGWQRDMAQQLLVQRRDLSAVPLLEKQAATSGRDLCRLHALCTLDGLGALTPATLERALADKQPGIRRHAVRLCEPHLGRAPELGAALVALVNDPDAQVRLQLAYTLGEWDDPRAGQALGQLAVHDGANPYLAAAVLSSVTPKHLEPVAHALLAQRKEPPSATLVENLLRTAKGQGNTPVLVSLLERVATAKAGRNAPWQFAALAGWLDALDQQNTSLDKVTQGGADLKAAVERLEGLFARARVVVPDPSAPAAERIAVMRLLGRSRSHQPEDLTLLANLLLPQVADQLQSAAIQNIGRFPDLRVAPILLGGWKGYGPALRTQVLDLLFQSDDGVKAVLDALERKQVLAFEVDVTRRQQLLEHGGADIRRRAASLFAGLINADRRKVVEAHRPALALKGDPERGSQVFAKTCATCHQFKGVGHAVGPNLETVVDKTPEWLLVALLDPNQAVDPKYLNYAAVTKNGLTFTGVLANEGGTSITLRGPDGKQQVILRGDLDVLSSSGKSLMPEGLEKDLKPQDLADLIAYIRAGGQRPPRRVFDGNRPALVRPEADGSLRLLPTSGEIYGTTITLDAKRGCLGNWQSEDDRVVWSVDVARPGKYALWLDWACASRDENTFVLRAEHSYATGKVAATGGWDVYLQAQVGEIVLQAGAQRLSFEPLGKLFGRLLELRAIRLIPVADG